MFVLFVCKDNLNGQSLGKRLMKIQIIEIQTTEPASNLKCMIRNLFFCLWPIELALALIEPNRRVGDYVTKTRLTKDIKSLPLKVTIKDILILVICFIIVYGITLMSLNLSISAFPLLKLLFE